MRLGLILVILSISAFTDTNLAQSSDSNTPTLFVLVDAPATAVEGSIITLNVRFFNIEPENITLTALAVQGTRRTEGDLFWKIAGDGSSVRIPVGPYLRQSYPVKVPIFSDRYSDQDSWPVKWTVACLYYSKYQSGELGFVSSATTIVTSSKSVKEPEINENGLVIQAATINLEPGETGKTEIVVTNLLPVDMGCVVSTFAFDAEKKSGSFLIKPFESRGFLVSISVPDSTDPGTYSYLAGVNAHEVAEVLQGKSFVAYASGAVIVGERESSDVLDFECIIATAAYGSSLNPTVSMMRHLRDLKIGSTFTGHNFVQIFNTWYYSWSPPVAKFIGLTEARRALARILLTPLTQTITASDSVYDLLSWSPEAASLAALQSSAFLCGLLYVAWPLLIVLKMNPMKTGRKKLILAIWASSLSSATLMLVGHLLLDSTISSLGSVTLSVSTMLVGAYTMTRIIEKVSMLLFKEWDHHARSKHRTPTP